MARVFWGALCLLLAPAGASLEEPRKGDECRAWTYGPAGAVRPFRCPKRLDGADARFCCGPCRSPFCCAAQEARLDPGRCLRALRRMDALPGEGARLPRRALKGVPEDPHPGEETTLSEAPPEPATLPSGHDAQRQEARPYTRKPRTTTPPPKRTHPAIPGLSWVLLGIAAILAVCCAICKFCPNPQECYTYLRHGQFNPPTPPPVHYSVRPPSPAAVRFDIGPPPYQKEDDLPPYYLRNPFDALARPPAQDSAACMELGVINFGFQEGEAATASSVTRVDSSASGPTGESAGTGEVSAKQVPSCAGEVASQLVPSCAGQVAPQVVPSGAGQVAPQVVPSGAGQVAPQVVPSSAGQVAPQVVPSGAGQVAPQVVPSGAGQVAPQVVPSGAGQVAPQVVPSGAGQVAPQVVPSGAGQVAPQVVPSGAGQVAAQVVPAAKGAVISAPKPTRKTKAAPFAVYWESKESEL